MTRGLPAPDGVVRDALDACDPADRDAAIGGWHASVIAAETRLDVSTVQQHLRQLRESGVVVAVNGLGPQGPRQSYLPADHPDAPTDEDTDHSREWVG